MSTGKQVFEYERDGDVLIVVPTGSLMEFRDSDVRDAYNETYRQLSLEDVKHLLIDFSKLSYFASTFVGMLIRLAKKARQGGGEAVLCKLSDNMRDMMKTLMLLENTKTDFFWVPFNSREEAIATLHKDQSPAVADPSASPPPEAEGGGGWSRFAK
jgi:anti-anti-sigma factor